MLIDWFTVVAQILNFIVMIWLMKRFLYQPILHAIDEREKRIAAKLADAETQKAEARDEQQDFKQKNDEFDSQRTVLMKSATDDANAERMRLLKEAHIASEELSAKQEKRITREALKLKHAIVYRAQNEIFAIARKVMVDLADANLEERICDLFIQRLQTIDQQTKKTLIDSFESKLESIKILSAFDLSDELRSRIGICLGEVCGVSEVLQHLDFEIAPHLVSGIELIMNGQKVAWSIDRYLTSLEKGVMELLPEKEYSNLEKKPQSPKNHELNGADVHAN